MSWLCLFLPVVSRKVWWMTRSLKPFSFYLFLFEKEGFFFFSCLMVYCPPKDRKPLFPVFSHPVAIAFASHLAGWESRDRSSLGISGYLHIGPLTFGCHAQSQLPCRGVLCPLCGLSSRALWDPAQWWPCCLAPRLPVVHVQRRASWAGGGRGRLSGVTAREDGKAVILQSSQAPPPRHWYCSTTCCLTSSSQVTKRAVLGWILNSKSEAYDGFSTQFKNDQNSAPGCRSVHQSESCRLVGSWKLPITIFHYSRARGKVRTSWHAEALDHSRAWPFIIQCLARKVKHESICLLMPERMEFPY